MGSNPTSRIRFKSLTHDKSLMAEERELFFLQEDERRITSLFTRELEIKEIEDSDGLRTCIIKTDQDR